MTEEEIKARLMDLAIQLNYLIREAYGSQIVANVETITKESGKDILYAVIKPTSGNEDFTYHPSAFELDPDLWSDEKIVESDSSEEVIKLRKELEAYKKALDLMAEELKEWRKLKLVCAFDGYIVYKENKDDLKLWIKNHFLKETRGKNDI